MSGVRILGLTGGIGSGKSSICKHLMDLGASIFEADQVARNLMECSEKVREAVLQTFGTMSYQTDGSLNRPWLAHLVFNNEESLLKLNAIVHPQVGAAFERVRDQVKSGLLVHSAALIFEAGLEHSLDAICVVSAPEDERIARVRARDGVSEEDVRSRMNRQLTQEESERRADVVLVNAGSLTQLCNKTRRLYEIAMSGKVLSPHTFKRCRRL